VAKALDVVGERWTLLIVRDLLLGPRRFAELQEALVGIPPALLTARLKEGGERGLFARDGARGPYRLTELGRELEPVVLALGRFGARYLGRPEPEDRMDLRWAMVSLKRRYRGSGERWTLTLRVDGRVFGVAMEAQRLEVVDGPWSGADVEVTTTAPTMGGLLMGRLTVPEAGDALQIAGEVRAFVALLASVLG
jgi:DNA-binding HxlR family transcriptional regulator